MKRLLILLVALAWLTISPNTVPACQCVQYGTPVCAAYWESDVVFVGLLRKITPPDRKKSTATLPTATLHFIVEQPFRGITTPTVDVDTLSGTSCDATFTRGTRYLIYAVRESSNQLFAGPCSRTTEVESAEEDLTYIRSLAQQGVKESIAGRVVRNRYTPVPAVKIEIRNENKTFETTSDEKGDFSVSLAGPGTYSVKVLVPSSVAVMAHREDLLDNIKTTDTLTTLEYKVELGKGQCDYRQFDLFHIDLHATAEVSGSVLTASGRPVDKGYVYLVEVADFDRSEIVKIEADGSFKFDGVPVGEYFLVLNPRNVAPRKDDPPYPRAFYPNAADANGATKIVVTEGAKLENLILRVGPALKARTISGKVVWPDGDPVKDAHLILYNGDRHVGAVDVDNKGTFNFEVYGDFNYVLEARVWGKRSGESERVAITDKSTNVTVVVKPK